MRIREVVILVIRNSRRETGHKKQDECVREAAEGEAQFDKHTLCSQIRNDR